MEVAIGDRAGSAEEGSDGGGRVGHGGCWLEVMEVLQVTFDWQSDYQLIGNF